MSEAQIQAIKDVIKMTPRLNVVSFEEIFKREGLTYDDFQDKN